MFPELVVGKTDLGVSLGRAVRPPPLEPRILSSSLRWVDQSNLVSFLWLYDKSPLMRVVSFRVDPGFSWNLKVSSSWGKVCEVAETLVAGSLPFSSSSLGISDFSMVEGGYASDGLSCGGNDRVLSVGGEGAASLPNGEDVIKSMLEVIVVLLLKKGKGLLKVSVL